MLSIMNHFSWDQIKIYYKLRIDLTKAFKILIQLSKMKEVFRHNMSFKINSKLNQKKNQFLLIVAYKQKVALIQKVMKVLKQEKKHQDQK